MRKRHILSGEVCVMKYFCHGTPMIHPRYRPRRTGADSKSRRGSLNEQRYTPSVHFTK